MHEKYAPGKLKTIKVRLAALICLIFMAVGGLPGCAPAVIYLTTPVVVDTLASSQLKGERANVRVVEDENAVRDCEHVKQMKASNHWGGKYQERASEKAISDLTHEALKAGANILLVRSKKNTFLGTTVEADSFICPEKESDQTATNKEPVQTVQEEDTPK